MAVKSFFFDNQGYAINEKNQISLEIQWKLYDDLQILNYLTTKKPIQNCTLGSIELVKSYAEREGNEQ